MVKSEAPACTVVLSTCRCEDESWELSTQDCLQNRDRDWVYRCTLPPFPASSQHENDRQALPTVLGGMGGTWWTRFAFSPVPLPTGKSWSNKGRGRSGQVAEGSREISPSLWAEAEWWKAGEAPKCLPPPTLPNFVMTGGTPVG